MKYKLFSFYIFIFLAFPLAVSAMTELENVGAVYPVVESDIRIEMKRRAAARWKQQKEAYVKKIQTYQPKNIQHLPKASQERAFTVDMTYTLDRDIKDRDGQVLYPKGYTFNPLDYMSLTIGLVVIDGADPVQINWFQQSPYASNHKMKLLLSGGSAQSLVSELNRAIFYLDKEVASRFQLAAVPSVVVQQGKHIQVREFFIEEKK